GVVLVFFLLCSHYEDGINRIGTELFGPVVSTANGYEDSLLRWLLFFNPVARFAEFLAGVAAAHLYVARRRSATTLSPAVASEVTLAAIVGTILVHLWLYGMIAPTSSFIGRTASPLYGSLVAIVIYVVARYDTPVSELLSRSLPVQLGEISYSFYMLH